uniref:Uncharacterized protein n=1 Tax=Solanum tuberosum TaxID=4113 RepID=M1DDK3_SOLTU
MRGHGRVKGRDKERGRETPAIGGAQKMNAPREATLPEPQDPMEEEIDIEIKDDVKHEVRMQAAMHVFPLWKWTVAATVLKLNKDLGVA